MSLLSVMGYNGCDVCPLDKDARRLKHPRIKPTGDTNPDIYVMGEFPSEADDETGGHMEGDSGQMFREVLRRVSRPRTRIRYGHAVRCHTQGGRNPTGVEVDSCKVYADEDILSNTPKVVVLVGPTALRWATGDSRITAWRGLKIPIHRPARHFWGVPVLSPKYVAREGGDDKRNTSFSLLEHDLRRACRLVDEKPPGPQINAEHLRKRVEVVQTLTEEHLQYFLNCLSVGLDLETDSLTPFKCKHGVLTCSLDGGDRTVAFPINHPTSPSTVNKEMLRRFLLEYTGRVVCHNTAFELSWLLSMFGPEVVLKGVDWHDSMCGQRMALDRESPLGLDEGCLLFMGARIKEATGVDAVKWYLYTPEKLMEYNGVDAAACLLLAQQLDVFNLRGNAHLEYERLRHATVATALMSHHGLPLNIATCGEEERRVYGDVRTIVDSIHALPDVEDWSRKNGKPFSPTSDQQVADFFEGLNLIQPGQGTAESVLKDVNHPLAPKVLEVRRLEKLISTYLSSWPKLVDSNSVLHPRYNVCLVATGRLSSEDPNIQNVPKRKDKWVRKAFFGPKGTVVLALDYSQLEIRILAMMCKDPTLVQELWAKADLHTHWMNRVIDLYPPILDRIAEEYDLEDEKKIRKSLRDEIKRGVTFALPYGSSKHTPGHILRIPDDLSCQLADEHRRHYPGIYKWQDDMRRLYAEHGYVVIPFTQRRRTGLLEGNEPLNTPIQGTASDLVVCAMTRLAKLSSSDPCLLPRINIHDDLTFFVPKGEVEAYSKAIAEEMVRVVHPMINVPIAVEASYGPNWFDQETVGEYSSTDFGHRRPRGQQAALPEVSPADALGGSWAGFGSLRAPEAVGEQVVSSHVSVRRPLRRR